MSSTGRVRSAAASSIGERYVHSTIVGARRAARLVGARATAYVDVLEGFGGGTAHAGAVRTYDVAIGRNRQDR